MRGVDIAVVLVATALCPNFIIAKPELTPSNLPNCPSENFSFPRAYYPNPDDKSTFYLCFRGVPILHQCPASLVWNSKLDRCGPQEDVHTTDPEANHIKCPGGDGAKDTLLPNVENFGTFFQCENGVPVLQYCPEGMDWNDEYKYCSYPQHVHRFVEGESSYKPRTDVDITIHDPGTYIYDCPEFGGADDVLLPHATNCNAYYKCKNGIPMLQICPSGQWWNDRDKICDSPENAQCAAMTTAGPSTTDLGNNSDGCPYVDNPYRDVLLPNPMNCKTFFKCIKGVPTLENCFFGMEWNDMLKRCDSPDKAHCYEMSTTTSDAGTNTLITSTSVEVTTSDQSSSVQMTTSKLATSEAFTTSNFQTTVHITEAFTTSNFQTTNHITEAFTTSNFQTTVHTTTSKPETNPNGCPTENGPKDVLISNPDNCLTFFKCNNGIPVLQYCPPDLEWNDETKFCEYSEIPHCVMPESTEPNSAPYTSREVSISTPRHTIYFTIIFVILMWSGSL